MKPKDKTGAERSKRKRDKKAALGLKEIRGLMILEEYHDQFKHDFAKMIAKAGAI